MSRETPRPEYPRPQMERSDWLNLNGPWEFAFDEGGKLDLGAVLDGAKLESEIVVPFPFESALSGIGDTSHHSRVWYARDFAVPPAWDGRRMLLHFGAVDYDATVWLNGREACRHRGGQVPFTVDVTDYLDNGRARLVVRAEDSPSVMQPRGKQSWQRGSFGCYYTRTTGIWQTVWLEPVSASHVRGLRLCPDIARGDLAVTAVLHGARTGQALRLAASFEGQPVADVEVEISGGTARAVLPVENARLWHPGEPSLYDLEISILEGGRPVDMMRSYFGMREVSIKGGRFRLNGEPLFQRLVLDQGFWPDGIWTAPSDEALRRDIELAQSFGFNGARKHQKVEDPRYYYWADRLGFLVWAEMGNCRKWDPSRQEAFAAEWLAAVERDVNHPSIVVWTPFNESWGLENISNDPRVRAFAEDVAAATRAADPTRPVNDNDGWEHTAAGDILSIHDYEKDGEKLLSRWGGFGGRPCEVVPSAHRAPLAAGVAYGGWPFLITEYGGIAYAAGAAAGDAWGYHGVETDEEAFFERFEKLHEALYRLDALQGFCHTQLTDVEQEINGLAAYDRTPKFDPSRIATIVRGERR